MLPINSRTCVSIGLRLCVAITLASPLAEGQRQREREGDKQTEGRRQASPPETRRTGAANTGQEARPPRTAAPTTAGPAVEPKQPASRTVGGTYRGPGGNPGVPDRQRPVTATSPDSARVPQKPGGYDRDANANRAQRGEVTHNQQGRVETYRSRSGAEVRYRPDGHIGTITRGNITIQHGTGNSRRIIVNRSDRSVVVTNRNGHGFVQRPFAYRGHEIVNRSYYLRGHTYSRFYRPYVYRGITLHSYVPTRYYNSGFYSWFHRPWAGSVGFAWGWLSASWYGHYRAYFTPYSFYPAPAYWLTDYVLSAQLADDYDENSAAPPLYGAVPLSAAVKQSIAIEVERQLAVERADADSLARNEMPDPQAGFPRLLSDSSPHVFIVSYSLDVADTAGGGCSISRGDVIRLAASPSRQATSAVLEVVASKPGSCRLGSLVSVGLEDLQDFYNEMRESLAQGVDELRSKAGMNGMPPIPANVNIAARQSAFVEAAPPPDTQVAAELSQELLAAEALETEATQDASQGSPQITLSLGQSTSDVVALLGNPKQVIILGTKQIYVYDRMKVTFLNGKVTDVE